ncbi:MAG TPA: amidohydrolase family protein, partial [Actinomycetota bacterium]|nr:amidohydrolase family protein [Actinomycetota bacterium]
HKANVWIELSGWAPRYLPREVVREAKKRLNERTLFGSDYPFIPLERWFGEFDQLDIDGDAAENIRLRNAQRLLGLG